MRKWVPEPMERLEERSGVPSTWQLMGDSSDGQKESKMPGVWGRVGQ